MNSTSCIVVKHACFYLNVVSLRKQCTSSSIIWNKVLFKISAAIVSISSSEVWILYLGVQTFQYLQCDFLHTQWTPGWQFGHLKPSKSHMRTSHAYNPCSCWFWVHCQIVQIWKTKTDIKVVCSRQEDHCDVRVKIMVHFGAHDKLWEGYTRHITEVSWTSCYIVDFIGCLTDEAEDE